MPSVAMGVMVVVAMATAPMEETTTVAITVETVASPEATMAMAAMEAMQLVVSAYIYFLLRVSYQWGVFAPAGNQCGICIPTKAVCACVRACVCSSAADALLLGSRLCPEQQPALGAFFRSTSASANHVVWKHQACDRMTTVVTHRIS